MGKQLGSKGRKEIVPSGFHDHIAVAGNSPLSVNRKCPSSLNPGRVHFPASYVTLGFQVGFYMSTSGILAGRKQIVVKGDHIIVPIGACLHPVNGGFFWYNRLGESFFLPNKPL